MKTARDALLGAMEAYFNGDTRRISHAHKVLSYATELLEREMGNHPTVIGAAILHDIGIHEAERKYGSTLGKYQEMEGPPIARQILAGLGYKPDQIEEICEIIAHHHSPGKINTTNFKIVYDADWLVNLRDEYNIRDRKKLASIINRVFLTAGGKTIAKNIYLKDAG
jgi:HD superfamily phosphodiesterase